MYRRHAPICLFTSIALIASLAPEASAAELDTRTMTGGALYTAATGSQSIRLDRVLLDGDQDSTSLELERFEVFRPDARIEIHGRDGKTRSVRPPPATYLHGTIAGDPDSVVVISVQRSGAIRGIIQQRERFWLIGAGPDTGGPAIGLASRELRLSGSADDTVPYRCDSEALRSPSDQAPPRVRRAAPAPLAPGQYYSVPVAIETDGEFFQLFGSSAAATAYIGDLFAYASTIYQREISSRLEVGYVSLHSGGPAADPWNHTSTSQGLTSFGNYWKANRSGVKRALAHFLSGRKLGGGIAWLGSLCSNDYGYGYSANLTGAFKLSAPALVWDLIVVAHEIGHTFGSPHTHDYQNILGEARAVDACFSNSTGQAGSLPGIGSLSGGVPGAGTGTIMSYCHLLAPGFSNLSSTFGQNHPYGIQAGRVSSLMSEFVADVAASAPNCVATVAGPSLPDFVINSISLAPQSPAAGGTFNATVNIRNRGTAASAAGSLRVWANKSTNQPCNTNADASAQIGTLAAGASTTATVTGIPSGAAGVKNLQAFIDAGCTANESNETNNQFAKSYTVTGISNRADFVVSGISLNPATPTAGGTFSASVAVKNQGALTANAGSLGVWANRSTAPECGAQADGYVDIGSVAAGATVNVTVTGIASGLAGNKTLRVFADRNCATAEADEANNQAGVAYTVRAPVTGTDLTISGLTMTPPAPKAYTSFSATVTVTNRGTLAANAGWLDLWLNQTTATACGVGGNAWRTTGTLAAGATATYTFTGLTAGAPGTKTLRAAIDTYCQTTEYDETNNQSTLSYTVAP